MLKRYCAVIPFYEDRKAGEKLFNRLEEMECPSIWCDGRFREFQIINGSDISTDGFREIIEAGKWSKLIEAPGLEVQKKWSLMFKTAGYDFKYAFLFGCDEYPVGDFDLTIDKLPKHDADSPRLFRIMMKEKGKQGFWKDYDGPKERLFFRPDLIEVRESHWAFYDRNFKDGYPLLSPPTGESGLIFYHNNQLRDKKRDDLMSSYQKVRVPGERARTMQSIIDNAKNKHLTTVILKELYPFCKVTEEKNYEERQAFRVLGKANPAILRAEYQSYVILPMEGKDGLYIRKCVVSVPDRFNNYPDKPTVVG